MNDLKDGGLHGDFIIKTQNAAGSRTLDLGALASKLSAIAAELRGEEAVTLGLVGTTDNPADLHRRQHPRHDHEEIGEYSDLLRARKAYAEYAREVYATRRRRTTIFGNPELFGEPAWDILLDLYIAYVDKKPVSVSSACIGSAAPPTTGLRWLGVLSENGLVLREHDPEDQRRVLVRLTERGLAAMDEYFATAGPSA